MKSFVIILLAISSFLVCADVKETTGYGSGDDIKQALISAKVDAILNAGGKTSLETEARHDKLVQDGGKSENEACLLSYEITEKGESFDGTYVRVKAKVSKDESYPLKDGVTDIVGEGVAPNAKDAAVCGICNAVIESGAKIKAVVKYENDELVADDATIDAIGFVSSVQSGAVEQLADGCRLQTKCKIFSDVHHAKSIGSEELSANGVGDNVAYAEAIARRELVLKSGSEFRVHTTYKEGAQTSFTATRCRAINLAAARMTEESNAPGSATVGISAMVSSAQSNATPLSASGIGFGVDGIEAHKSAICDAIVNRAAKAKVAISYVNGCEKQSVAEYTATCNYFGEESKLPHNIADGFLCETTVKCIDELPEVAADIAEVVEAIGFGRNKSAAVDDAKQRAVDMVFGSPITVCVKERDGRIAETAYEATHSEKGYVSDSEVLSEDTSIGISVVKIRATVKNHDGDSNGWGWITIIVVVFVISGVFMFVKEKLGIVALTIVWILTAIVLVAIGHWGVGITAVLLGIGATKAD